MTVHLLTVCRISLGLAVYAVQPNYLMRANLEHFAVTYCRSSLIDSLAKIFPLITVYLTSSNSGLGTTPFDFRHKIFLMSFLAPCELCCSLLVLKVVSLNFHTILCRCYFCFPQRTVECPADFGLYCKWSFFFP